MINANPTMLLICHVALVIMSNFICDLKQQLQCHFMSKRATTPLDYYSLKKSQAKLLAQVSAMLNLCGTFQTS